VDRGTDRGFHVRLAVMVGLIPLLLPEWAVAQQGALDARRTSDASSDRNILFSTAETLPAGSVTVNDYEILLLGASVGLTDRVTLTAGFLPFPVIVLHAGLKVQVARTETFLVSVMPTFGTGWEPRHSGRGGEKLTLAGGLVFADALLWGGEHEGVLSVGGGTSWAVGEEDGLYRKGLWLLSAGLYLGLSERWKLLGELSYIDYSEDYVGPYADEQNDEFAISRSNVCLGLRFAGPGFSADLSGVVPFALNERAPAVGIPLPFLAVAARF
jgi:hypothetical protein